MCAQLLAHAFLPLGAGLAHTPPLAQAAPITPVVLLILCVVAGVATVLLLPSRLEAPLRKIGAVVLLAVGLIFAAVLVRWTARSTGAGMGVYFWVFATIALVGAFRVVTHIKPVYSALYFVLTVFATAGLFLLLWAEFMAVALVLIYAGAILVTYVFVIMLAAEATSPATGATRVSETDAISREPLLATAVGFALMGIILLVIFDKSQDVPRAGAMPSIVEPVAQLARQTQPGDEPVTQPAVIEARLRGPVQQLGAYLFRSHVVNLELAGLILTVAMVGAIVIARKRVLVATPDDDDERGGMLQMSPGPQGETILGPVTPVDDDPHSIPVYGTRNPRQKEYPET